MGGCFGNFFFELFPNLFRRLAIPSCSLSRFISLISDFDGSMKNNLIPSLSPRQDENPVGYPEFHPVEDGRADIYIIKVVIKPGSRKAEVYRWKKYGVYKRVNGETKLLKSAWNVCCFQFNKFSQTTNQFYYKRQKEIYLIRKIAKLSLIM